MLPSRRGAGSGSRRSSRRTTRRRSVQAETARSTSSGWTAAVQPSPKAWSAARPASEHQRSLTYSYSPVAAATKTPTGARAVRTRKTSSGEDERRRYPRAASGGAQMRELPRFHHKCRGGDRRRRRGGPAGLRSRAELRREDDAERLDAAGVERRPRAGAKQRHRVVVRPRAAVHARRDQRVVDVADGEDPRVEREVLGVRARPGSRCRRAARDGRARACAPTSGKPPSSSSSLRPSSACRLTPRTPRRRAARAS